MEETILKPVPGLKGFLCDTDNMVVYKCKKGIIRPLTPIGFYKKLSLYSEGKTCVTTLYRVVYCTEHDIDIRKIPSNFCFSFDGKKVKVCERKDIVKLAARKGIELGLKASNPTITAEQDNEWHESSVKPPFTLTMDGNRYSKPMLCYDKFGNYCIAQYARMQTGYCGWYDGYEEVSITHWKELKALKGK